MKAVRKEEVTRRWTSTPQHWRGCQHHHIL